MAEGPIIFASDDSDAAMIDAKSYISKYKLTRDDVKLVVRNFQTLVIAKRNCMDKLKGEKT